MRFHSQENTLKKEFAPAADTAWVADELYVRLNREPAGEPCLSYDCIDPDYPFEAFL